MEKQPAVSIIVPVYKVEKYLHRCVDSLLAQAFQDFEVLLVDDGSPDRSGEICDEYAKKDSRVRVFHKENGGVSSARNIGLDNMRGEYVTFIDADDWIDIDCLEKGYSILRRYNLDILQYSYRKISEEDESIISVHIYECDLMNRIEFIKQDHYLVCVWGNFIRTAIVENHHLRFDESLHLAEDQIFIMTTISLSDRIAQTSNIYYNYFQNSSSATHNSKAEDIVESSKALLKFGKKNLLFKPHIDRMIASFYFDLLLSDGQAEVLNKTFYEEKMSLKNLHLVSMRLLLICSFLNMNIACKVVVVYLKLKRILF